MLAVRLWEGLAVASVAAAAVLVYAIVRATDDLDHTACRDRPGRAEPPWWPEFERAFAEHVCAGDLPKF